MIPNIDRKTMNMEARDTNYFFQAYLISYLLISKNEDPVKIIVPKFPSFPHPRKPGVEIPIEWVDPDSPVATDIAKDGSNVPETEIDEKPTPAPEDKPIDAERKAGAEIVKKSIQARKPKMPPGGDLGTGHPDGLGSRDVRADRRIATDLKPEASVDESKELETDIEKPTKEE